MRTLAFAVCLAAQVPIASAVFHKASAPTFIVLPVGIADPTCNAEVRLRAVSG